MECVIWGGMAPGSKGDAILSVNLDLRRPAAVFRVSLFMSLGPQRAECSSEAVTHAYVCCRERSGPLASTLIGDRLYRSLRESEASRQLYQARRHASDGPGLVCPWYEKPHHPLLQGLLSRCEAMTALHAHRSSRGCSSVLGASGVIDASCRLPPVAACERKESNVQTLT